MKRFLLCMSTAVLIISCNSGKEKAEEPKVAAASTSTPSTETKTPAAPAMPDSATMMKNWEAYMTPGEVHKMMASWKGNWMGDMTMWMSPDAPPEKFTGTMISKMALGGRYQQSVHKATFNKMPFEGQSTLAYDNMKKTFISTWIDNMGTGMMVMEGPWDPTTKSITFRGRMMDPMQGKEIDCREVFKVIDDNFHVMEMYCSGMDGKEYKSMEIKYTRQR
jgi:hypothetical protein